MLRFGRHFSGLQRAVSRLQRFIALAVFSADKLVTIHFWARGRSEHEGQLRAGDRGAAEAIRLTPNVSSYFADRLFRQRRIRHRDRGPGESPS